MEIIGVFEKNILYSTHTHTPWSYWKTAGTYPMSEVCFIVFLFHLQ